MTGVSDAGAAFGGGVAVKHGILVGNTGVKGAQLSKGAEESEVIKAGGKGEMSLTYCQRRKAYYICVLHLHKGLAELLSVMSVCAIPRWPQECSCGVCVAGVEGYPIARRACPLPPQLTKEDHNERLRARIPNHGTGTAQESLETGQCLRVHLQLLSGHMPKETHWDPWLCH